MTLRKKIYDLLFEKSTVDGVRLIHEDRWPVDKLHNLFKQEMEKEVEEREWDLKLKGKS